MWARRRSLEQSDRWSREQLDRHQRAELATIRAFAMERSPFYARFHRGLDRQPLGRLPILTKATVMEHFDELVTDRTLRLADIESYLAHTDGHVPFRGQFTILATSGSTGQRGVFVFDRDEWITCLAMIARPMAWAGVRPRVLPPLRSTMVASTSPWHYSAQVGRALANPLLPTLRLDAGQPVEHMVARLNAWRPDVLVAYPSVLRLLAAEQVAGRLRISPTSCATSAEVLTQDTRQRVREALGVHIFETYGATEYAPIAAECRSGNKHLLEDGAVIEIVDDRGHPTPPGEQGGRVLLTVFGRRTQPLIRYEISDIVRLSAARCDCGRPYRCVDAIDGRQEDILSVLAKDSSRVVAIHPNVFHRVLETAPASAWQVIQERDGLVVNLVSLQNSAFERVRIERAVQDAVMAEGAQPLRVRVEIVTELTRGATSKAPLVMARQPSRPPHADTPR